MNKDKNIPVGFSLEQGDLNRPSTGRPVIYANNGIISSGHYLTSMAGMKMFQAEMLLPPWFLQQLQLL